MRASNRVTLLLLLLLLLGCYGAKTTLPKSTPPTKGKTAKGPNCELGGCNSLPIPEDLQERIQETEGFGLLLYDLDYASAKATDLLFEKKAKTELLAGYLPLIEGNKDGLTGSYIVVFYSNEKIPRTLYQVLVYPDRTRRPEWLPEANPEPVSAGILAMIKARQRALDAVRKELVQPSNPIVLGLPDRLVVYLLSGTNKPNLAILGKHYRLEVSTDGEEVKSIFLMSERVNGFTADEGVKNLKSIKPIAEGALEMPYNEETAVLTVTNVVTDWPLESHVFANLLYGVPIYVVTKRGLWLVEEGHISYVSEDTPWINDEPPPTD